MGNYDFSLDLSTDNTMSVINNWITDGSTVLEFGPANGRLTRHLALNRRCSVTIVERDYEAGKEAAQYAVKSYLGAEEGDIEHLEWKNIDGNFDYIIFADVLEHLSEPEKVLRNASALLNQDGRILISVPNISHNSIIISLLNDRFTYSSTGLLDFTHVHFFAYKDLEEMIRNVGLYIIDLHQIYSRVGNNEIDEVYSNVSGGVGKVLRQRTNGSTYQFVLNLSKSEIDQCNSDTNMCLLEEDKREEFESLFFYTFNTEEIFNDELRRGTIYAEGEITKIVFDMESVGKVRRLRWNPLPFDGVINILQADLITKDEQVFSLKIKECNVERVSGRLLIFYDAPWIEFEIPSKLNIGQITITFQVLAYREKNTGYYEQLNTLLDAAFCTDTKSFNYKNGKNLKLYIEKLVNKIKRVCKAHRK